MILVSVAVCMMRLKQQSSLTPADLAEPSTADRANACQAFPYHLVKLRDFRASTTLGPKSCTMYELVTVVQSADLRHLTGACGQRFACPEDPSNCCRSTRNSHELHSTSSLSVRGSRSVEIPFERNSSCHGAHDDVCGGLFASSCYRRSHCAKPR